MKNLCERKDFFSRSEQVKVNLKVTYNILTKDAAVHKTKSKSYKLLQHLDKIYRLHSLKLIKLQGVIRLSPADKPKAMRNKFHKLLQPESKYKLLQQFIFLHSVRRKRESRVNRDY